MSNEENLIQNRTDITPEQRRANARKAGLASAAAKKRRKNMKNSMQELLNMEITPAMKAQMQSLGLLDCDWTYADWINVCAMQQAMKGNVRAMEFIRDTAGFNPELALKEQMFEYEKQKEQGAAVEIEDISDVLALIHGYSAWEEILNDGVVCMPIKTITYNFGQNHLDYIKKCHYNTYNIAEGAVRAGKTVDNVIAFAYELCRAPDKFHLATGSTMANAKLNIGDANGFGLEYIFRGQCRWSKYKDNDCLIIRGPYTNFEEKVVIFAGGKSSDSYKKIRGNSYGMWIATEINLHHDNTIKEAFNRQLAAKKIKIFWDLNPEHPKAPIYVDYLDKWEEKNRKGTLVGGYNYEHFTIFDNINITQERIDEIISRYDPGSIWYIRDIEGKRSIAEGLIYTKLATSIAARDNKYLMRSSGGSASEREENLHFRIRIPVNARVQDSRTYISEDKYKLLDDEEAKKHWTLQKGCYIITGTIFYNGEWKFDDFDFSSEVITSSRIRDFLDLFKYDRDIVHVTEYADNTRRGSDAVKHWRVGGA